MRYVGMDVHKGLTRVVVFDPASGEVQDRGEVATQWESLATEVRAVGEETTVVLEAGRNSHFLAAHLEAAATRVWVVDPAALRRLVPRGTKTDARDARGLAEWAAAGKLSPLWRPSARSLALRELTRGRRALTKLQGQVRMQLRTLLARHGYEIGKSKDLLSVPMQAWLDEVAPKLDPFAQEMLVLWRVLLPMVTEQLLALEPIIAREAKGHAQACRLQTLPGVGWYLGLMLAVEIDDVTRFAGPSQLRSYSGMCPEVRQRGERRFYGPLTKRGNKYLRWAAGLAAQAASRRKDLEPRLRQLHTRVAFKHGKNPAKMQLARALLTLAHHLLVKDEDYRPRPAPR